jgi:superfamily II DNA or RNA helicase
MIIINKIDEVYIKVLCPPDIAAELEDYFSFFAPGYRFSPLFKTKKWNGKTKLFRVQSRTIYAGLKDRVLSFASDRGYDVVDNTIHSESGNQDNIDHVVTNDVMIKFNIRDYQMDAFVTAIEKKRQLLIAPTSAGKSLIIYLITKYINNQDGNVLIIVPTIGLVTQMMGDFKEYSPYPLEMHAIHQGQDKKAAPITISTWQSIHEQPKSWFNQFDCIIGDEVHLFKANCLKSIMEKSTNVQYRIGTTGTLDNQTIHQLTLEGLFGPVKQVTTYKELLQDGHIVKPDVKIIFFKYDDDTKRRNKKGDYPYEVDFLNSNRKRNMSIKSLVGALDGNVLVLFSRVEAHGKPLHELLKQSLGHKDHHMIYGGVDKEERERIRQMFDEKDNMVASCSYQTFGTGINAPNIHHIVFASPSKSKIRVLQAIGRGLRKHSSKDRVVIWDLSDDLKYGKEHLKLRIEHYNSVGFEFTVNTKVI